jgi:hypothetical protein
MIAAEVRGILLVAFSLMNVVGGVVGVWNEIDDWQRRNINVRISNSG